MKLIRVARQGDAVADQPVDPLAKKHEALARLEPPEEDDLVDRHALTAPVGALGHQWLQVIKEHDVRLHEGPRRRQLVALAPHPPQQMRTAADDDVGELDALSLRDDLGEIFRPVHRLRPIEPVPQPRRGGLHDEERAVEGQPLALGEQAQVSRAAPLGDVHDIHMMLEQISHHVVGGLQPPVGAGLQAIDRRIVRHGHEFRALGRVMLDPLLDGAVLDVVPAQIEDRRLDAARAQHLRQIGVGRPDAAVADRADDLLGGDADVNGARRAVAGGQLVQRRKFDVPGIGIAGLQIFQRAQGGIAADEPFDLVRAEPEAGKIGCRASVSYLRWSNCVR